MKYFKASAVISTVVKSLGIVELCNKVLLSRRECCNLLKDNFFLFFFTTWVFWVLVALAIISSGYEKLQPTV